MTIVGGVLVGLSLQAAVEYSFLLGVLTLTAATAKKAVWPARHSGEAFDGVFGRPNQSCGSPKEALPAR